MLISILLTIWGQTIETIERCYNTLQMQQKISDIFFLSCTTQYIFKVIRKDELRLPQSKSQAFAIQWLHLRDFYERRDPTGLSNLAKIYILVSDCRVKCHSYLKFIDLTHERVSLVGSSFSANPSPRGRTLHCLLRQAYPNSPAKDRATL